MTEFTRHDVDSAPGGSAAILDNIEGAWSFIPNLHAILAESPAALEGYSALFAQFEKSSFSAIERQVVYLSVIFENECTYCMAGHTMMAKACGLDEESLDALREGRPLTDPRLQALRHFTQRMVVRRGWLEDGELESFLEAGFTRQQVLEVILAVSTKILSNYVNHVACTPIDAVNEPGRWTPPSKR